jgi:hypothetical protein
LCLKLCYRCGKSSGVLRHEQANAPQPVGTIAQ